MLFSIWATTMIPGVSILVPLYLVAVETGLYDTYFVLVLVYSAWAVPTLVWLMRGFVSAIPVELEEAARVDGCSTLGAFYRVTLPLLPPGMLAGGIMVFLMIWNEFLIGYSLVISNNHRIIQAGLYSFVTEAGIEWGPLMAAVTCSLLPVALFYAVLQRYFVQGLTGGSLKG
jgi:ABC-type glycerol-3-phosphate transport system permease component